MRIVSTQKAPQAIGPYSQAIEQHGRIYTSGQIPLRADGSMVEGDVKEQTRQVMENLEEVLQAGGSSLLRAVKTTIYLVDMADYEAVNEVYATYFKEHRPARSAVAVAALPKGARVEIECIAAL